MSDRTSAILFGQIFEVLVKDEGIDDESRKRLARKFWKISAEYDFAPCEMDAKKEAQKLDLMREVDRNGEIYHQWRMYADSGWQPLD
jgi:hypothetical protein